MLVEYNRKNIFILYTGWGLGAGGFLLPNYDITFAEGAESYKRRRKGDRFEDFAILPTYTARPIVFPASLPVCASAGF